MQHDEMIWQVINHQFCSFKTTIGKAKSDKTHFCQHPYSVTGLCNRTSCPLANSKYATIREEKGRVHLYIKTVERAHSPKNLWEKILLSRNYSKATAQLDEHLAYFPKVLIHRNKQRLTKIHQYLIRMRKIKLKEIAGRKAKMVGIHRKIEQREERRERKALVAAKLERNIQKELVDRLAKGTYGDIYNFPEAPYQKALQQQQEKEEEEETDEETDEEEEGMVEYVEDLESDEEEEQEDIEDVQYMGMESGEVKKKTTM
ncbi:Protein MAK16 homolog [Seminavis robusta]|uniref:Protein MAK16 homolog n=1 Tax=Seminavis robusta TaxID=568900 RepID=A0A9N8EYI8_9STRA|nr:Protein MAK16 homolog [Seminavis robusta]|eukprot:Sro2559_g331250.1 Protein MAK16 homolog (259) ;mRNA; r:238-1014